MIELKEEKVWKCRNQIFIVSYSRANEVDGPFFNWYIDYNFVRSGGGIQQKWLRWYKCL